MQQIVLKIDNQIIENQIIELSKYQNEPVEKICLDAILYFVNLKMLEKVSEIELKYKILDIDKTENKLHFEIDNSIEFESIELFPQISSGAEYISNIRKSGWRK